MSEGAMMKPAGNGGPDEGGRPLADGRPKVGLLSGRRFRGPFVPLRPDESLAAFAARMRERERRVPFRRWRPVWQVQAHPQAPLDTDPTDEPGRVVALSAYSSLMRRDAAVLEGRRVAAIPNWRVRVVDVGTGVVAFAGGRLGVATRIGRERQRRG